MIWTGRVIVVAVAVKPTAERGAVEAAHPSQANVKRVGNGPLSGAARRRASRPRLGFSTAATEATKVSAQAATE